MRIAITMICILLLSSLAYAVTDTPENRAREADRYIATTPPEQLLQDMTEKVSMNVPPEHREKFIALMTKHLDIDALTESMRNALIKHFTANELSALADFYGSPVGKSAMGKFGVYMAEVMPTLQKEMVKAVEKTRVEFSADH